MPEIKIDGKVLNNVNSFTYLRSSLSSSNSLDKEISNCIAKASASYADSTEAECLPTLVLLNFCVGGDLGLCSIPIV
ncbi:hypothetical protein ACOMHN_061848 [Nucella lapillus]